MNIELINTGSELLLGRVLNSHQQWICSRLADCGYVVTRQVAVPDTGESIQQAVREGLQRADIIITTGGLGPTSDDITRDLIAQLLGRKLQMDSAVLEHIENFFKQRKRCAPARTTVQAMVPEGAMVLPNPNGTAPGLAMLLAPNPFQPPKKSLLIMLPGPPRELRPMFLDHVIPQIKTAFPLETEFVCRTLRTTGMGESFVEERIDGPLAPLVADGLQLGYCARVGEVDVRLVWQGHGAKEKVARAECVVRELLGNRIFGDGDDALDAIVVKLLTERKETLALAESCTGGYIANRITNVSGASVVFPGGIVSYSNEAKMKFLGVRAETLDQFGAVSEPTVREMAEGARRVHASDYALAVSGIAGPTGGTPEKPVGTVYIALATPDRTVVEHYVNRYDRETFKFMVSQQALDLLRRNLLRG